MIVMVNIIIVIIIMFALKLCSISVKKVNNFRLICMFNKESYYGKISKNMYTFIVFVSLNSGVLLYPFFLPEFSS